MASSYAVKMIKIIRSVPPQSLKKWTTKRATRFKIETRERTTKLQGNRHQCFNRSIWKSYEFARGSVSQNQWQHVARPTDIFFLKENLVPVCQWTPLILKQNFIKVDSLFDGIPKVVWIGGRALLIYSSIGRSERMNPLHPFIRRRIRSAL